GGCTARSGRTTPAIRSPCVTAGSCTARRWPAITYGRPSTDHVTFPYPTPHGNGMPAAVSVRSLVCPSTLVPDPNRSWSSDSRTSSGESRELPWGQRVVVSSGAAIGASSVSVDQGRTSPDPSRNLPVHRPSWPLPRESQPRGFFNHPCDHFRRVAAADG